MCRRMIGPGVLTRWEIIEQKGTDSLMLREHALGPSRTGTI